MWVCHRSKVKGDAIVIAESEKRLAGELSVVVHDDAIGDAKLEDDVLKEPDGPLYSDRGDVLGLNPLGELVDVNEEMCEAPEHCLKGPDHV